MIQTSLRIFFRASRYRCRIPLALTVLELLLSGCAQTSIRHGDVSFATSATASSPARIEGLRARFERMTGPDSVMRVLVVNGMATDAHGYSFDFQNEIAARLGEGACVDDQLIELDAPAFIIGRTSVERQDYPPATLRLTHWARNDSERSKLTFYEILWTPYADAMTDEYLAPFETDLRYASNPEWKRCGGEPDRPSVKERRVEGRERPRRALVNAAIKDGVMIGGLTDAVLSLGPLGAAARDAIRQGICLMAADALEVPARPERAPRCRLTVETLERFGGASGVADHLRQHEFTFLTYSLGSFMLLDSLDEFRLWPGDLGPPEMTCRLMPPLLNETPVFMFSNQVSLLLAAHPQFGCDPKKNCELYSELGDHRVLLADPRDKNYTDDRSQVCKIETRTQIVAFNDPNDVVGYRVPDYLTDSPLIGSVINVRVRNPAFRIPGLLVSPTAAHTNHGDNKAILEFILEGWPQAPQP